MKTLLVIEDDRSLQEIIRDYFSARDYDIISLYDGEDVLEVLGEDTVDIILLDVMLPEEDGFSLCRKIRKQYSVPILFLTARVTEKDKLYGYSLGADDYITKPFSLPVLYAKVEALRKRVLGEDDTFMKGDIEIRRNERTVLVNGETVNLPPKQYEIMLFLMENEGRIFSREQLLLRFWGYDFEGNERAVDNHIKKLRQALGEKADLIRTHRKYGWSFSSKGGSHEE